MLPIILFFYEPSSTLHGNHTMTIFMFGRGVMYVVRGGCERMEERENNDDEVTSVVTTQS